MRALIAGAAAICVLSAWGAVAAPAPQALPDVKASDLVSKLTRGIRAAPARNGGGSASAESASIVPSVDLNVPFQSASAALSPDALPVVNALGKALTDKALSSDKFLIEGHTDTVGDKAKNLSLSERRAKTVMAYLEKHFGIAPARLSAKGVGQADLAVQTADQVDEPQNRRVKVANLGAG